MAKPKSVDDFIDSAPEWAAEKLIRLRRLALEAGLEESIKWSAPCYSLKGNVLGLAAFKGWVSLWFHQGSFLKDESKKLLAAQETTQGLRQWRFLPEDEIDEDLVLKYILEAKANDESGKKITPRKQALVLPEILKNALAEDTSFKKSFEALTPGKQKEYALHIGSAKREATQISRLEKSKPMIFQGVGLHDKYKNC
jgi:uncharacterized protein YdeI (YjbR/CyaY-like superfamily)